MIAIKERPILRKGPEVRAILRGATQLRRTVKLRDPSGTYARFGDDGWPLYMDDFGDWHRDRCPYGKPGQRLWVREAFGFSRQDDDINGTERVVCYRSGLPYHITDAGVNSLKRCRSGELMQPNHHVREPSTWRPSIHMPRWASRILLELTDVRVQRLQEISEEDAQAEGAHVMPNPCGYAVTTHFVCCHQYPHSCRDRFAAYWDEINGPGSWDANPWVWALTFKRIAT